METTSGKISIPPYVLWALFFPSVHWRCSLAWWKWAYTLLPTWISLPWSSQALYGPVILTWFVLPQRIEIWRNICEKKLAWFCLGTMVWPAAGSGKMMGSRGNLPHSPGNQSFWKPFTMPGESIRIKINGLKHQADLQGLSLKFVEKIPAIACVVKLP